MRRILFSKTYNTRDIGGFQTLDGKMTAWGRFFRSDVPQDLSKEDRILIEDLGIKTIVDLRSDKEAKEQPGFYVENAAYEYHRISMHGLGEIPPSAEDIPPLYLDMVGDIEGIRQIFNIFIKCDGAVLYHCAGGKDRTGIITALLLMLVNVPTADIEVDYSISELYLMPILRYLCEKYNIEHDRLASKLIYIEAFLSLFRDRYHTAEHYFRKIGFSDRDIDSLKKKVLGES